MTAIFALKWISDIMKLYFRIEVTEKKVASFYYYYYFSLKWRI